MFTRLLVGLDGSARADAALEQAVVLATRFHATVVVAHAASDGPDEGRTLVERGRERLLAAGLEAEVAVRSGAPDEVLTALAEGADAVLVGRHGTGGSDTIGPTVKALLRRAARTVIVCAGQPSPMRACAVAFDARDTSQRALELAIRFASVTGSTVHVIHAAQDREEGLKVVGVAEAQLSLQRVSFTTHVESGRPAEVVARVVHQVGCDALFTGAHIPPGRTSGGDVQVSNAEEILRHTAIPVIVQP